MAVVTALATTPVKGLRVTSRSELTLTASGAPDDRRFYLVDERGWMVNGKHVGELSTVVAEYRDGTLTLTFPGGEVVGAAVALGPPIDTRWRMLVEIDGVTAHAEDDWVGAVVRIGEALVRFGGHVGRCLITSRHPESGVVDLPTLDLLRSYRRGLDTTEPLAFGVYGEVLEGGRVAVGDAVAPG